MSRQLKLAVLLIARSLGGFALLRWLTRRQIRILCYHGGCQQDERAYKPKLFCTRELLEKRLSWLRTTGFTPVTLDWAVELINGTLDGSDISLPVVVTVDDGWHSSCEHIFGPLQKHRFPSTLYLATDAFLSGRMITDVVIGYLLHKASSARIAIDGIDASVDGEYDLSQESSKAELVERTMQWLSRLSKNATEQAQALERFSSAVGVDPSALGVTERRFSYITDRDLRRLAEHGTQVEAHGHRHIYPLGDSDGLRDDVEMCALTIERLGLPRPRHYCYPSGVFDGRAPRVLSRLGIVSATTCRPGLVRPHSGKSLYFLPRFLDGEDVDQLEFEAEMSGFNDLLRWLIR